MGRVALAEREASPRLLPSLTGVARAREPRGKATKERATKGNMMSESGSRWNALLALSLTSHCQKELTTSFISGLSNPWFIPWSDPAMSSGQTQLPTRAFSFGPIMSLPSRICIAAFRQGL